MSTQTIICLVVFVATLALYMSNKFPLPLVSMTAMGIYDNNRMSGTIRRTELFFKLFCYHHGLHVHRGRRPEPHPDGT